MRPRQRMPPPPVARPRMVRSGCTVPARDPGVPIFLHDGNQGDDIHEVNFRSLLQSLGGNLLLRR